mgnify:CR=1 FL=1|jgi:hypothetical protein
MIPDVTESQVLGRIFEKNPLLVQLCSAEVKIELMSATIDQLVEAMPDDADEFAAAVI